MIDYDVMTAKSSAAANLAAWVINVVAYNRIYVKVKPLKDALRDTKVRTSWAKSKMMEEDE